MTLSRLSTGVDGLDELLGGVLANANTVIYLGKIREGTRFCRALYVAKHRGSTCPDEIIPYQIGERGIRLTPGKSG